jgi:hypothetical protein
VEHSWNKTDNRRPEYKDENMTQYSFVHHKSHMDFIITRIISADIVFLKIRLRNIELLEDAFLVILRKKGKPLCSIVSFCPQFLSNSSLLCLRSVYTL